MASINCYLKKETVANGIKSIATYSFLIEAHIKRTAVDTFSINADKNNIDLDSFLIEANTKSIAADSFCIKRDANNIKADSFLIATDVKSIGGEGLK